MEDKNLENTYPVILMGPEEKESLGFSSLRVICCDGGGANYSESHFKGEISVQMVNDTLIVYVKKKEG
jgi:hypothetical protein